MKLTFGSLHIPGSLLKHDVPAYDLQFYDTHFFGVTGISRITGAVGGRHLVFPFLLYDGTTLTTRKKIVEYIEKLNKEKMGKEHTVKTNADDPGAPVYDNCVFHGAHMTMGGEIQDVGGNLGGGWLCYLVLRFFQRGF
jgi:hypothetical protein